MAYKTLCQQGHHEYSLGLNVQTKDRCIYCGQPRAIAVIKRFILKMGGK